MSCSRTGADCKCTCTSCNCCQCVAFHRELGEATGCMFTPAGERTNDRSLKNLMRDRGITLN
jgi:hypothetical protein